MDWSQIGLHRRPFGGTAVIAAAVLPFLTLTIAYSALAVARFALPPTLEASD